MKLAEALRRIQTPFPLGAQGFVAFLAVGFETLHLKTFFAAHLMAALPGLRVEVRCGTYGDLAGNLHRALSSGADGVAVALEWPDLDPRLGVRGLGGWDPEHLEDMVRGVERRLDQLLGILQAPSVPVILSLPTLPLLPVFLQPGSVSGAPELRIREALARFAHALSGRPGLRLVSTQRMDSLSAFTERHDVRNEIASGFPYHLPHASALAALLAEGLTAPPPKKGLITDLDDTLWRGILGDDGLDGISWDLDHRSQMHGLYQQLLKALAETGTLVAVASKNSPALVEEALACKNLHIGRERLFPVKAGWGPKAAAVADILRTWNIGAADVVFVDDSAMELDEMSAAFPSMVCLPFPADNEQGIMALLWQLRDLFGKEQVREEDRLRLESLRSGEQWAASLSGGGLVEDLLEEARPEIILEFGNPIQDQRAFELINKTNQVNLNGRRFTESEWAGALKPEGAFLMTVTYSDKSGPLGKIAAIIGEIHGDGLRIGCWVMSCRAFSRRIEFKCLETLFNRFAVSRITLETGWTDRNLPLREFLAIFGEPDMEGILAIDRAAFFERCPPLYHHVKGSS
jgi:FkbH-like protein